MVPGADAMQRELYAKNDVDGPQFKLEKDPRLTRIGRWIRPCSLDELPQLVNVALGQMSLVGPRPSPFRENQTCVPWREGRLSVRPGITGLWQVCRHDRANGVFHPWIHYDLLYVEHMSALQNVCLSPVHVYGKSAHEAAGRASELFKQLGVETRADALPRELSGGEAQRVAIARALAVDPPVLLMDEPMASLDPPRRAELGAILQRLTAAGRTLVVTSHDEAFAQQFATRILQIQDGKLVEPDRR